MRGFISLMGPRRTPDLNCILSISSPPQEGLQLPAQSYRQTSVFLWPTGRKTLQPSPANAEGKEKKKNRLPRGAENKTFFSFQRLMPAPSYQILIFNS